MTYEEWEHSLFKKHYDNKCVVCGKFISKDDELFCKKCVEAQHNNEKLQAFIKTCVRIR